jgi:hypothetical protein
MSFLNFLSPLDHLPLGFIRPLLVPFDGSYRPVFEFLYKVSLTIKSPFIEVSWTFSYPPMALLGLVSMFFFKFL